MNEFIIEIKM